MIQVAMIFAAGRGERMRPLTDEKPKPLLEVAGKPLIVWQIEALARAGIRQIVINTAWLGEQIPAALGTGEQFGVQLYYSEEQHALETAGGIAKALRQLQLLSDTPIFLAVSGDIYTNFDYETLHEVADELTQHIEPHMHLIMVENPSFHTQGDFVLHDGQLFAKGETQGRALTFGNIGLYDMRQFEDIIAGEKVAMSPYYKAAIEQGVATGAYFDGVWENVGTPEQLHELNERLNKNQPTI